MGTELVGDHLCMGTEFDGDRLSKGINFMGIDCPGGQEVGDQMSGDPMGSGPNASQPLFDQHILRFLGPSNAMGLLKLVYFSLSGVD